LSTINNKIREPGADIIGNSILSGGESEEKVLIKIGFV